ncbi:putative HTH-type transcriptional regulator [Caprobacter fermentans]|uniref:MerR family transcriptional regulator n=1 Tax=Caproicibacter fermentans TaxID=2576756 RepID=A0A6N8HYT3_9FIRM|nr:MerR family transcriptional regulator [Caproicibacter fermentans]MVB11001.1 putative HTH-type transcriptional regulator [Caproicibacter fermentans]OCN01702.1 MerR family transcriptional regulator [Clostridium sp. W14A]QNK39384.1 MerR family transcriptional regulator [Caproicibacter fermentans]
MSYLIGEFSRLSGISIDTLRYYEKEKLIAVNRNSSGRRIFTDADLQWISFIKRLKETGMPIQQIRRYAFLRGQGDSTLRERLTLLKNHRAFVLEQKRIWEEHLSHLDQKMEFYEKKIAASEK